MTTKTKPTNWTPAIGATVGDLRPEPSNGPGIKHEKPLATLVQRVIRAQDIDAALEVDGTLDRATVERVFTATAKGQQANIRRAVIASQQSLAASSAREAEEREKREKARATALPLNAQENRRIRELLGTAPSETAAAS